VTLGVPIAQYADRCNRRNLIAASVALWSAMTAVSGLAANIWHLTAARIGVGIGEAGCSPPAHSMIADYFPPEKRSTAMGFYTMGISAGIMTAYLAGGWVAQNIGWREAFFVVGIPGLLLAAIVRFTIQEPQRGESESRSTSGQRPRLSEVFRFLASRRSFLHMATAAGLSSFVGYSVIGFLPSFMVRSFDMELAALGRWLGLILGISGGAGFFFGGYFADHLGRGSHRKALNYIAATMLVSAGLLATMFMAKTSAMALLLFILPAATTNVYLAPVLAQTQNLVALRMRATSAALILLIINVIGLAFGPLITGSLSDFLEPRFAEESMRYSLLIVTLVILPWAVWHYYRAGKWIDADLARATDFD
jgi:MFS family permease